MIALVPASLWAADSVAGMVRPYGTAWLNGTAVEQPSTVFPGDLVQTSSKSALKIRSSGSSVTILADSVVKFEGAAVGVERGAVKLATSKGMFARAGIVTATPASSTWTEFELTHVDGMVQIVAIKGDLQVSDGSQTTTLPEGQQTTQKDKDTDQTQDQEGPVPAAKNNRKKVAIILVAAGAATAGAVAWVVVANSGTPRTISPVTP